MFIPASYSSRMVRSNLAFQSRDWVDVYSGLAAHRREHTRVHSFNPATGLMFIPAMEAQVESSVWIVSIPRLG